MTDKEMEKLLHKMEDVFATKDDLSVFATNEDHVHLEEKVDDLTERVNTLQEDMSSAKHRLYQLPTKEELLNAIHDAYNLATLKAEHDRIKKIISEKLHVEV